MIEAGAFLLQLIMPLVLIERGGGREGQDRVTRTQSPCSVPYRAMMEAGAFLLQLIMPLLLIERGGGREGQKLYSGNGDKEV